MPSCRKKYIILYLHRHKNEMTYQLMIPFIVINQEASDSDFFIYDLNKSTSFLYVSRSPDCSKLEQINDNYQAIRSHERGRAKQRWILLKGERYPSLSLLLCQNTPRHQCPNLLIPSLFPCIPDVCLIKKKIGKSYYKD